VRDDVQLLLRLALHVVRADFAQHVDEAGAAHLGRDDLGGYGQRGQQPGQRAAVLGLLELALQNVALQGRDVANGFLRAQRRVLLTAGDARYCSGTSGLSSLRARTNDGRGPELRTCSSQKTPSYAPLLPRVETKSTSPSPSMSRAMN